MKFDIHQHEGAGPVRFGMTPEQVREAVGGKYERVMKGEDTPMDVFGDSECFVFYDKEERVEAIEFSEPGQPMLGGVDLLGVGFAELVDLITAQDPDVELEEGEGFTSRNLGIGCWAPDGEDRPDAPAETVIVFRRGYYDY